MATVYVCNRPFLERSIRTEQFTKMKLLTFHHSNPLVGVTFTENHRDCIFADCGCSPALCSSELHVLTSRLTRATQKSKAPSPSWNVTLYPTEHLSPVTPSPHHPRVSNSQAHNLDGESILLTAGPISKQHSYVHCITMTSRSVCGKQWRPSASIRLCRT